MEKKRQKSSLFFLLHLHLPLFFLQMSRANQIVLAARDGHHASLVRVMSQDLNAEVNQQDPDDSEGFTALHYAADQGNLDILQTLLGHKLINVNSVDRKGKSPLFAACESERIEVIEELLRNPDVDVNLQDKEGQSALWKVASLNVESSLKCLLENCTPNRLNLELPSKSGKTAMGIAQERGHQNIVDLLRRGPQGVDRVRNQVNRSSSGSSSSDSGLFKNQLHLVEMENIRLKANFEVVTNERNSLQQQVESLAQELRQLKNQSDVLTMMVEFEGKTVRVDLPLPLPTLTDIQKIFSDRFNLDFVPEIRYLDEEISRIYITVDDVKHFPRSSRLLKLSKGPLSWWLWERLPMQSWKTHGTSVKSYRLLLRDGTTVFPQGASLYAKFRKLAPRLGIKEEEVRSCSAVLNSSQQNLFEEFRRSLAAKHASEPGLFKKEDWRQRPDFLQRMQFIDHFREICDSFEWNERKKDVNVIAMCQGTNEIDAWKICDTGFGVAGMDNGFFGKGMYFTSQIDYAQGYANESRAKTFAGKQLPRFNTFIIAAVIPGNPFPVTEDSKYMGAHCEGTPCETGYQSHYTIVGKKGRQGEFYPIQGSVNLDMHADELVVFETAQTLPLFVVQI